MKHFVFALEAKKEISSEENGWAFRMKCMKKIGYFYLQSPIMKEVTQSKGTTVRYAKHSVFGIGYVDDDLSFKGLAFFDFGYRCLFALTVLSGVSYSSGQFYAGIFWALMFYLFISAISSSNDDGILHKAKKLCEM